MSMKIGGDVPPFFGVNAALSACLYLVDVGLNSSIEYGDLPGQDVSDNSSDSIVSFVQVLLQIAALVNLLMMLGGTFLFRSGLFGMLYSQFRLVLLVHLVYICLTIILGVTRMNLLSVGVDHVDIWETRGYAAFSGIHKIGAVVGFYFSEWRSSRLQAVRGFATGALCYYACSIFAVERLRHRKFYSHEYWMRK